MNIRELAKEAGFDWHTGWTLEDDAPNRFETFAALVAAHEREECADIAENWRSNGSPRVGVAAQIRARGTT
jgi:hypothetical protein